MPGSQCSTVSESESLCSATSCNATVETNVLVLLPARNRSVPRSGRPLTVSATPAALSFTPCPSLTSVMTPGEPAETTPRICDASGAGVEVVAVADLAAGDAALTAAAGAARSEWPQAAKAAEDTISAVARTADL